MNTKMFATSSMLICTTKQHCKVLSFAFRGFSSLHYSANNNISVPADIILTAENRSRCLHCMQQTLPPFAKKEKQLGRESVCAAVLIPICVDAQGETSILYTRRSGRVSRHTYQISFPGGIKDPEDLDFIDCALRETEEEIGLGRDRVEVWGTGPLIIPRNTAKITPVFGIVRNLDLSELTLNKDEVEEAFTISIGKLADHKSFGYTQYRTGWISPTFKIGQCKIWGLTAFMTYYFLNCLLPKHLYGDRPKIKYIRPYRGTNK